MQLKKPWSNLWDDPFFSNGNDTFGNVLISCGQLKFPHSIMVFCSKGKTPWLSSFMSTSDNSKSELPRWANILSMFNPMCVSLNSTSWLIITLLSLDWIANRLLCECCNPQINTTLILGQISSCLDLESDNELQSQDVQVF